MKIGIIKETKEGEKRVGLTPNSVKALIQKSYQCIFQESCGEMAGFSDEAYLENGASKANSLEETIRNSDIVISLQPPSQDILKHLTEGKTMISPLYHRFYQDKIKEYATGGGTFISLDAIPRISRAQSMDILSSQSNLSGYKAVLLGANEMDKIFPLLMTAAGTIKPARVLIFGVGVAGLQAIATAKRLGAVVEATDVRLETKEEAESLGAKFITVEGDGVKTEGGYAKEVTAEYLAKQKEAVNKSLYQADLVITTALVMGRKAPVLIDENQVKSMKKGAVIVDMAVEQGGNCVLSEMGKTVIKHGVKIVGPVNLPSALANNASELFGRNVVNFLDNICTPQGLKLDMNDEIIEQTLIIHNGEVRKSS
jgi:H+-translocating NAD(P) transhydrogenase subunit alpha